MILLTSWIEAAQKGDQAAYEQIVSHFKGMAYAVAYEKLRDTYLAEDAVQEAFEQAFSKLSHLDNPAAFPGWFRTIVERSCYRMIRRRNKKESFEIHGLDQLQSIPSNLEPVEETASRNQMNELLRAAVEALPLRSRIPVELFYFYGYSLGEISGYLETSQQVLKKRLFDARSKLKSMLPVSDFTHVFHNLYDGGIRMLHIVNGDTVADKLKQAEIQGEILVWREIYSQGPLFEPMESKANRSLRAAALEQTLGIPSAEYKEQCQKQESVLQNFRTYDEVVLWFEHDLFDQAMLSYLLHWFAGQETRGVKLNLLSIGSFPGIERFRGLGQLSPLELTSLSGTWHRLQRPELELGSAFWKAYISRDPRELAQLLAKNTSLLPFAKAAFTAHLSRLPSVQDGLGCVEYEVLGAIQRGVNNPYSLFREVGDKLDLLGMGDLEFWAILNRMAGEPMPLLKLEGSDGFPDYKFNPSSFKEAVMMLTEQGDEVLNGRNRYVLVDTEEVWYGGIHMNGAVKWGWDREKEALVFLNK